MIECCHWFNFSFYVTKAGQKSTLWSDQLVRYKECINHPFYHKKPWEPFPGAGPFGQLRNSILRQKGEVIQAISTYV